MMILPVKLRPYMRGTLLSVLGGNWILTPGSFTSIFGILNTPNNFAVP